MSEVKQKIKAPNITKAELWQMNDVNFNKWRRLNDLPRIISFLKQNLPEFDNWMLSQNVTDEILIEHFPSTFLKEREIIYIYGVKNKDGNIKELLRTDDYNIGETFFHQNKVLNKNKITPYPNWYCKNNPSSKLLEMRITSRSGRSYYFMDDLELLDLGDITLNNYFFGEKNLDFTNLDNLNLNSPSNNKYTRIWFSSAVNLAINGDFPFIDAYKTPFYEVWNSKFKNLQLNNGTYQDWILVDCEIKLNATNSTLFRWKVIGYDFSANLNLSNIDESNFSHDNIKYPIDIGRAKELHKHIKLLYSSLGKKKEASEHYFLEKTFERKSYISIRANHRKDYSNYKKKRKFLMPFLYLKYYLKYIYSGILNILWGYGEKPKRVFYISGLTIILFSLLFFYHPHSSEKTKGDILNSFYYSLVTFSTLGAGDITQTDKILKLFSGLESVLGVTFWGILIAGFSNNAKDY